MRTTTEPSLDGWAGCYEIDEAGGPETEIRFDAWADLAVALGPVAMTGSLAGSVVDPSGLPVTAHVVVRDDARTTVRECYPVSPRAGAVGGQFEVRGLSPGFHQVEIAAPGFLRETRAHVWVEAAAVSPLGTIRLQPSESPLLSAVPARAHGPPLVPKTIGEEAA